MSCKLWGGASMNQTCSRTSHRRLIRLRSGENTKSPSSIAPWSSLAFPIQPLSVVDRGQYGCQWLSILGSLLGGTNNWDLPKTCVFLDALTQSSMHHMLALRSLCLPIFTAPNTWTSRTYCSCAALYCISHLFTGAIVTRRSVLFTWPASDLILWLISVYL